jgi:hypothetical protein
MLLKENEMGRACSTHGRYARCILNSSKKNLKGEAVERRRNRWNIVFK